MRNLLKHNAPLATEVGGVSFKIDYFYDTALDILDLLQDDLWTAPERMELALSIFYMDEVPPDHNEAAAAMMAFLNGGDEVEEKQSGNKILDFEQDGNLIYTAFMRVYNLDLEEHPIHWWKFLAMLNDIGEAVALQSVLHIRTMDLQDVPEKKRGEIMELKRRFDLEHPGYAQETLEERNARWLGKS